jgi:hypothetical protein
LFVRLVGFCRTLIAAAIQIGSLAQTALSVWALYLLVHGFILRG